MAEQQPAATTRRCSSCKCHKPQDEFATSKTCNTCLAKKEIRSRENGRSKRRKGRATEGPAGTQWCAKRKWCPIKSFSACNATCDSCIQAETERQIVAKNITAATAIEGWDVEALVVRDSLPIALEVQHDESRERDLQPAGLLGADAESSADGSMTAALEQPSQATLDATSNTVLSVPVDVDHLLSTSYTPEGTEPISDDVDSAMDDVTRMLGQQLRLEAPEQLFPTDESRLLHYRNRTATTDPASAEVFLLIGNLCVVCGIAANQWCSRCRLAMYCGRQCQRRHWKAGHKQECAAATQKQPVAVTDRSELRETECPVCLDEFEQPVKLPCSHAMCCGCLKQLRESNVGTVCPMCRAQLPPGPEVLFDDSCTMHVRAERAAPGLVKQRLEQRVVELEQAAAAQGDARAQYNLGICYVNGEGVEQSMQRAVELYQSSAAQGYAEAQCSLAVCYLHGKGVEQSMQRAVELYQSSAAKGYAQAQSNLGVYYQLGRGVEQNKQRAVELYLSSAAQGYAVAQCNLGLCYQHGEGVEQSMQRAVELYQSSAAKGYAQGQYNLARCYEHGNGVEQSVQRAVELYRSAAAQGFAQAQCNLAQLLCNGYRD